MIQNFLTIAGQVLSLFILISIGFFFGKKHIFNDKGVKCLTDISLYLAVPCVIIQSFLREYDPAVGRQLLESVAICFAIHLGAILIATLVFRDTSIPANRVYQYATVFSNAGYMALPLQAAVLGDSGVLFGAVYVAVFNLISWTWGVFVMSGTRKSFSAKKLINPGTVSVCIGVIIFLCSVPVPKILRNSIGYLAGLNTPLPMMIIGYYLAGTTFRQIFLKGKNQLLALLRLLVVPLAALGGMYLCGIRGTLLVSMTIAASAPAAANTTMYSVMFHGDEETSVSIVSLTTVYAVVTMPIIVALSQLIS